MLFRSAHIYILLAALMNVMAGHRSSFCLRSQLSRRRRGFIVHTPSLAPCLRLSGHFFI
jgi:hypothetical protein